MTIREEIEAAKVREWLVECHNLSRSTYLCLMLDFERAWTHNVSDIGQRDAWERAQSLCEIYRTN